MYGRFRCESGRVDEAMPNRRFCDGPWYERAGCEYTFAMNKEAEQLMAEALRVVKLNGSFSPSEIGARIGFHKIQAESAARSLSNAGVLVLGFDCAAHFSPDFRKARESIAPVKRAKRKRQGTVA